ncbi:MAG: hypothetical protein AUH15_01825 [Acidobacteriales bacterium 13_2_20CM_55_8]|nr:MAG: hypothetical protein AUH15_01825 [Acidobacteriales bacterium 13_2_20CM_55_8]
MLGYRWIAVFGSKMMAGAESARDSQSSFGAAVLKMLKRTWKMRYKSTSSGSYVSTWGEVHSGLPSLAVNKRKYEEKTRSLSQLRLSADTARLQGTLVNLEQIK